jgi:hypothetical protein
MIGKRRVYLKNEFQEGEWCVAKDLNVVTSRRQSKRGSDKYNLAKFRKFNGFIDTMKLVDILVFGKQFSWFSTDGSVMTSLSQ